MLPQLEKNQEILPSTRDEVLFHCGVSREIPPSFLSLKSVFDTFEATQELPQHTCLHSRGTPGVLAQLKKSPGSSSSCQKEDLFPCFVGEGISVFPSHLKRRRSPRDAREELHVSFHNFKRPPISQYTPDTPDSPALIQWYTPRTDSKHDG